MQLTRSPGNKQLYTWLSVFHPVFPFPSWTFILLFELYRFHINADFIQETDLSAYVLGTSTGLLQRTAFP